MRDLCLRALDTNSTYTKDVRGKERKMTLRELPIGKTATIKSVGGEGALRQHFLDMGLIPQGDVTMVKYAPMGDPMELRIHSYELTLRLADAEKIERYIETKVDGNLKKLHDDRALRELMGYSTLRINGTTYRNLNQLGWMFEHERLNPPTASAGSRCGHPAPSPGVFSS